PKEIILAGWENCGPIAAAARVLAGDVIDRAAIDTTGFRFANLDDYRHPMFLPGGAKYHDLPGILAAAPGKLWLTGEGPKGPELLRKVYSALDAESLLTIPSQSDDAAQAAAIWIGK